MVMLTSDAWLFSFSMMNTLLRVPILSGTIVGAESDCSKPRVIPVKKIVHLLGISQYAKLLV